MSRRSRAREVALQTLYRMEVSGGESADLEAAHRFHKGRLQSAPLIAFADALVEGVLTSQADLDAVIDAKSQNWRLSRMAATDRAVLRIAAFELLHSDTPGPVVIDEAIDLARRYGSEASSRFVAGILGGILQDHDGRPRPAAG